MTKDAVAGRIRRLLAMADKRAAELGIPDTEANLTARPARRVSRRVRPAGPRHGALGPNALGPARTRLACQLPPKLRRQRDDPGWR